MNKINYYGTYTLIKREVARFLVVYHQTIITPALSALIFLSIFMLAIGQNRTDIQGIKFVNFMGYGLIAVSITQNSFANSSSSLIMSKILGYIGDILTPPLSSKEIIIALVTGSIARGILVGISVTIFLSPFVEYNIYHPILLILFVLFTTALLGQIGILSGLIANSFDQIAAITNYLIMPLSFLSGTFYSVKNLPEIFMKINIINPFFYIVDGFRYCLTDIAESNISAGLSILIILNILMFITLNEVIHRGWRIKN